MWGTCAEHGNCQSICGSTKLITEHGVLTLSWFLGEVHGELCPAPIIIFFFLQRLSRDKAINNLISAQQEAEIYVNDILCNNQ